MRKALATAALAGGLVLAPVAAAGPAFAAAPALATTNQVEEEVNGSTDGTDVDEPGAQDGDDDSGRWGLTGLLGMLGLFGYKKYRDHRASSGASGQRVGVVDSDGSGSTRI